MKSDEIKKQIERQSSPFREHVLLVISSSSSERGIQNTFNNCWLNSLMQIICGSLKTALLPLRVHYALTIESLLHDVAEKLTLADASPIPVDDTIKTVSRMLEIDPEHMQHVDVEDAFQRLVLNLCKERNCSTKSNISFELWISGIAESVRTC